MFCIDEGPKSYLFVDLGTLVKHCSRDVWEQLKVHHIKKNMHDRLSSVCMSIVESMGESSYVLQTAILCVHYRSKVRGHSKNFLTF